MEKVKRSEYFFLYIKDLGFVDLSKFFEGKAELSSVRQIFALSILKEQHYEITREQMQILWEIPLSTWVSVSEITEQLEVSEKVIGDLADKGLLLSDAADERFAEMRSREEQLASAQWNIHAALYHFMTKWQDVDSQQTVPPELQQVRDLDELSDNLFASFVDLHGKPPEHFYSIPNALRICDLPLIKKEGEFYEVLTRRKTTRVFDSQTPMALEDLSTILYYVWGCHGILPVWQDIMGLKKTSPSGGDLHPIEVYPLVRSVNGLDSGLYHYNVQNHSLELLTSLSEDEAAGLADEFTAKQHYPRSAHVSFIMTARFYRNFWKYRQHQKSYSVILMDAAHLSQTLYLVCTQLGLGAYITAAINTVNIDRKLELDGITEGAIVICGCGIPLNENTLDPKFHPYTPRETV